MSGPGDKNCTRCGGALGPADVACPSCGEPLGALEGKWALAHLLGKGGMGTVWRARDLELERDVAIKMLASNLAADADLVARFEREARLMARLDHPNLIPVYAVGRTPGGVPFIVMKLLAGETLGEHLARHVTLTVSDALAVVRQVCAGLQFVHERGVVHRDIKPANVFVGPDGHVTLLDLGVARDSRSTMTVTGMLVGTPRYMSPEQVLGRKVDHRADLYALAAMTFELVTREPPFDGDSDFSVLRAHVEVPPPDASALADVSPALGAVLQRGLAKSPDERFQSATEFFAALEAAARGSERRGPSGTALHPVAYPPAGGAPAVDRRGKPATPNPSALRPAASAPEPDAFAPTYATPRPEGGPGAQRAPPREPIAPRPKATASSPTAPGASGAVSAAGPTPETDRRAARSTDQELAAAGLRRRPWGALVAVMALVLGGGVLVVTRPWAPATALEAPPASPEPALDVVAPAPPSPASPTPEAAPARPPSERAATAAGGKEPPRVVRDNRRAPPRAKGGEPASTTSAPEPPASPPLAQPEPPPFEVPPAATSIASPAPAPAATPPAVATAPPPAAPVPATATAPAATSATSSSPAVGGPPALPTTTRPKRIAVRGKLLNEAQTARYYAARDQGATEDAALRSALAEPEPEPQPAPATSTTAAPRKKVAWQGRLLDDAQTAAYLELRASGLDHATAASKVLNLPKPPAAPASSPAPNVALQVSAPTPVRGPRPPNLPKRVAVEGRLLTPEETEAYYRLKYPDDRN